MLKFVPLSSALHSGEIVRQLLDRLQGANGEAPASDPAAALLIATGGTERLALELLTSGKAPHGSPLDPALVRLLVDRREPVLLVAHPFHNSLPAALEILARLRQIGRRGKVLFIDQRHESFPELERAEKIVRAHQRLSQLRLGQLGEPSEWLIASMPSAQTLHAQWGPRMVSVDMSEVQQAIALVDPVEARQMVEQLAARASGCLEPSVADLQLAAQVALGVRRVVKDHRLDALTIRCFDLVTSMRTTGCLAVSGLIDEGIVAGCEGDLPATLTMIWLHALTGELPFMANPQEVDMAANSLWLAHCAIGQKLVESFRLRSHFESSLGVALEGTVLLGDATLARIGGEGLDQLFISDGRIIECGSSPERCRTQIKLRLEQDVGQLLTNPLGNHHVLIKGCWSTLLREYHQLYIG